MKDSYEVSVKLQCHTCGATYAFVTDEKTGYIHCNKCNRTYYGGYDELVSLNRKRIDDEQALLEEELVKDLNKEINKIFKNIRF